MAVEILVTNYPGPVSVFKDQFRRRSVVHKTRAVVYDGTEQIQQVVQASGKPAQYIFFRDVIAAVRHSFCHSQLGQFFVWQSEVYKLHMPGIGLQAPDQLEVTPPR